MPDPAGVRVDVLDLSFFDPPDVVLENGGNALLSWCRHGDRALLFKHFTPEHLVTVDEEALLRLVRWRRGLSPHTRDRLDALTAWPLAAVYERGALAGVLVPAADGSFFTVRRDGRRTPRDLFELAGAGPAGPTPAATLAVLGRFIQAVRWLHGQGVVVDDLQQANVLYAADGPATGVYLVDCDSTVAPGRWNRVGPPAAPDLMQEVVPASIPPSVDTDLVKLRWVVVRVLLEVSNATGIGDQDVRRLAAAVPEETRTLLLHLVESPADPAAWDALAGLWTAAVPAPAAPVLARPRGWLPAGYAYRPDPGPPVLPARLRERRGVPLTGGRILLVLTALVVASGLALAAMVW